MGKYNVGGNMYSKHISIDANDLKIITKDILNNIHIDEKKYENNLQQCNLTIELLANNFFDKEGNIFYKTGNEFYIFDLCIKELAKIF